LLLSADEEGKGCPRNHRIAQRAVTIISVGKPEYRISLPHALIDFYGDLAALIGLLNGFVVHLHGSDLLGKISVFAEEMQAVSNAETLAKLKDCYTDFGEVVGHRSHANAIFHDLAPW
jgi:hypothetical protein